MDPLGTLTLGVLSLLSLKLSDISPKKGIPAINPVISQKYFLDKNVLIMSSLSSLSLETSLPKSKLNSSFIQIGILTNFLLRLVVSFIFILRIIYFNFSRDIKL